MFFLRGFCLSAENSGGSRNLQRGMNFTFRKTLSLLHSRKLFPPTPALPPSLKRLFSDPFEAHTSSSIQPFFILAFLRIICPFVLHPWNLQFLNFFLDPFDMLLNLVISSLFNFRFKKLLYQPRKRRTARRLPLPSRNLILFLEKGTKSTRRLEIDAKRVEFRDHEIDIGQKLRFAG